MEGNYLPGSFRVKIVNEVRSTHFEMGGGKSDFTTMNNKLFKGTKGEKGNPVTGMNVSHVPMGSGNNIRTSEFTSKYRSYTEESRIRPLKPSPTLTVGQGYGNYSTTTHTTYQKPAYFDRNNMADNLKVRKHNFDFGTDKFKYQSEMQRVHGYKQEASPVGLAKEIKEKYNKAAESSEKMTSFIPTSFQNYREPKLVPSESPKRHETHIKFDTPIELSTTAQVHYSLKHFQDASLSPSQMANLKSSHFNLGGSPNNYTLSSSQAAYEVKPVQIIKSVSPSLIQFGSDKNKYKTDYSRNFAQRAKSETRTKPNKKHENFSYVNLGEAPEKLTTENRSNFKSVSESPGRLPKATESSLKSHHFRLGTDGLGFNPVSRDYRVPGKVDKTDPKLSPAKMNSSNWEFGKYKPVVKSEVQQEYNWRGSPDRKTLNKSELRKSHFNIGSDKKNWQSCYKTNYGWIQPVPDRNYKVSLMNS